MNINPLQTITIIDTKSTGFQTLNYTLKQQASCIQMFSIRNSTNLPWLGGFRLQSKLLSFNCFRSFFVFKNHCQ